MNSLRILNLNDDVIDFFHIKYEKVGRISAGVGVNVEITFLPKVNEDIHTGIFCLIFIIILDSLFIVLIIKTIIK